MALVNSGILAGSFRVATAVALCPRHAVPHQADRGRHEVNHCQHQKIAPINFELTTGRQGQAGLRDDHHGQDGLEDERDERVDAEHQSKAVLLQIFGNGGTVGMWQLASKVFRKNREENWEKIKYTLIKIGSNNF